MCVGSVGVSWVFVFNVCGQCWCELGLCVASVSSVNVSWVFVFSECG